MKRIAIANLSDPDRDAVMEIARRSGPEEPYEIHVSPSGGRPFATLIARKVNTDPLEGGGLTDKPITVQGTDQQVILQILAPHLHP